MPSPALVNSKQQHSPLMNRQLRSPRGSPRSSASTTSNVLPLVSRHFRYLVLCCFPLLLLLQWSITFSPASTSAVVVARRNQEWVILEASRRHAPRHGRVSSFASILPKQQQQQGKQNTGNVHDDPLESYNYAHFPLVPSSIYTPHSNNPLPVIVLGTAETQHAQRGLLLDGLERSRYVRVLHNAHDWQALQQQQQQQEQQHDKKTFVVIHLVDWAALEHDCHFLRQMYGNQPQPESHLLVYWDMSASTRVVTCPSVNALFHKGQFRVVKQSIVNGRHWRAQQQWVSPGKVVAQQQEQQQEQPNDETGGGVGPVLHAPHFLREEFVDLLTQAVQATTTTKDSSSSHQDLSSLVTMPRKLDVVHVWRKGDAAHYGQLRRQVSRVITDLNGTQINGHSLRWLVRPRGDDDGIEQSIIQAEYVVTLMNSKIVVVAQRDEWEDHFRLMESLASGALVLTDTMLAPPHGLKNGTSIVTYHDATSLRNLILYYAHPNHQEERLTIAQEGWEIAMGRHRSWHRMEQLLFGAARSKVDKPLEAAPPRRSKVVS